MRINIGNYVYFPVHNTTPLSLTHPTTPTHSPHTKNTSTHSPHTYAPHAQLPRPHTHRHTRKQQKPSPSCTKTDTGTDRHADGNQNATKKTIKEKKKEHTSSKERENKWTTIMDRNAKNKGYLLKNRIHVKEKKSRVENDNTKRRSNVEMREKLLPFQ